MPVNKGRSSSYRAPSHHAEQSHHAEPHRAEPSHAPHSDHQHQSDPLPENWVEKWDKKANKAYYYNTVTTKTSLDRPANESTEERLFFAELHEEREENVRNKDLIYQLKQKIEKLKAQLVKVEQEREELRVAGKPEVEDEDDTEDPLPEDWIKDTDKRSHKTYFYNSVTKESMWEDQGRPKAKGATKEFSESAAKAIYREALEGDEDALAPRLKDWAGNEVINWANPDAKKQTPLMAASSNGKTEAVRLLLKTIGIEANKVDERGETALIQAAYSGKTEATRLLLAHRGIDIQIKISRSSSSSFKGLSALGAAIMNNQQDVVAVLIDKEAELTVEEEELLTGSKIYWAADGGKEAALKKLLQESSDATVINWAHPTKQNNTPLIAASAKGKDRAVELLLQTRGIDVNKVNARGETALIQAAINGNDKVVELLLAQAGINIDAKATSGDCLTALGSAIENKHPKVATLLRSKGAKDYRLADPSTGQKIYDAAEKGNMADLPKLMADWVNNAVLNWANPNASGWTPLIVACHVGKEGSVLQLLGTSGIDANKGDNNCSTALVHASYKGHVELARLLLAHQGIETNLANRNGETPLILAASTGKAEIVELLLAHPDIAIDTTATEGEYKGRSALSVAIKMGHHGVAQLLRAKRAKEPLVEGPLPKGWVEHCDKVSRHPYYLHIASKTTQWDRPEAPVMSSYLHCLNMSRESVYVDSQTGDYRWMLPDYTPLLAVRFKAVNPDGRGAYYEDLSTGTKAASGLISQNAKDAAERIETMDLAACEAPGTVLGKFDEINSNWLSDQIETLREEIYARRHGKPPQEYDYETKLMEEYWALKIGHRSGVRSDDVRASVRKSKSRKSIQKILEKKKRGTLTKLAHAAYNFVTGHHDEDEQTAPPDQHYHH